MDHHSNLVMKRGMVIDEADAFVFSNRPTSDGAVQAGIELVDATIGAIRREHLNTASDDYDTAIGSVPSGHIDVFAFESAVLYFALTGAEW